MYVPHAARAAAILLIAARAVVGQSDLGGCGRWCGSSDSGVQCQPGLECREDFDRIFKCSGTSCGSNEGNAGDCNYWCGPMTGTSGIVCQEGLSCSRGLDFIYRCNGQRCRSDGYNIAAECRKPCGPSADGVQCATGLSCVQRGNGVHYCSGNAYNFKRGEKAGGCNEMCGLEGDLPCKVALSCRRDQIGIFTCQGPSCGDTREYTASDNCDFLCGPSDDGSVCFPGNSCELDDDGLHRCDGPTCPRAGCYGFCGVSGGTFPKCEDGLSCDQGDDGTYRCSSANCPSAGCGEICRADSLGGIFKKPCNEGLSCDAVVGGGGFYRCTGSLCGDGSEIDDCDR